MARVTIENFKLEGVHFEKQIFDFADTEELGDILKLLTNNAARLIKLNTADKPIIFKKMAGK